MAPPLAVLLDVGGVFLLPDHERVGGAFTRAEYPVPAETLDDAHYAAAVRFGTDLDAEAHAGSRERAEPGARAGDLTQPQRRVGELAVEVGVHVFA